MYKETLEALKTKFDGISAATLSRIAKKIAKTATTSEEVTEAVEALTLQKVIDSVVDSRATEAAKTAVENYKASQQEETPEPKPTQQIPTDEAPAWAKGLTDTISALTSRLEQVETQRAADTRKAEWEAVIKDAPDGMKSAYNRLFSTLVTLSDEDFATQVEEIRTELETHAEEKKSQPPVFSPPFNGGKNNSGSNDLSDEEISGVVSSLL